MRRLTLLLMSLLVSAGAFAASPAVWDIDITLDLCADGSAAVTEVWNVSVSSGTEWYLVRENLGQIRITDLAVSDETGREYTNIGEWNINRSLDQKAGKCGIVHKKDGCELCWGVGSYGSHVFTACYLMSGVIDGYSDYDAFHFQIVTPELSSAPQHVKVTVRGDTPFSTINTRFWAFGFPGTTEFQDGNLIAESSRALKRSESVILLIQLNKGMYAPVSESDRSFDSVREKALEGASFEDDVKQSTSLWDRILGVLMMLVSVLGWIIFPLLALIGSKYHNRKKVLGCKLSDVGWCRDIPCKGNILEADYILGELGEDKQKNTVAGAMILRMIKNGNLLVSKDAKDRIEISFNDARSQENMYQSEKDLYVMLKEASGSDVILQHNEFSRWSAKHASRVNSWVSQVKAEGRTQMGADGYLRASKYTESGQAEARKVVGFRKFLDDFTIIGERASQEVALWHDYLVFAALYGIADKVAKELKDINPQAFEQMMVYDYTTMNDVVRLTRNMANSITNVRAQQFSGSFSPSRGGFGGFTSIGGGGGFHGGGFGGGSR